MPAAIPSWVSTGGFHASGAILGSCAEGLVKPEYGCCWLTLCSEALGKNSPWFLLPHHPQVPGTKNEVKENKKDQDCSFPEDTQSSCLEIG